MGTWAWSSMSSDHLVESLLPLIVALRIDVATEFGRLVKVFMEEILLLVRDLKEMIGADLEKDFMVELVNLKDDLAMDAGQIMMHLKALNARLEKDPELKFVLLEIPLETTCDDLMVVLLEE